MVDRPVHSEHRTARVSHHLFGQTTPHRTTQPSPTMRPDDDGIGVPLRGSQQRGAFVHDVVEERLVSNSSVIASPLHLRNDHAVRAALPVERLDFFRAQEPRSRHLQQLGRFC